MFKRRMTCCDLSSRGGKNADCSMTVFTVRLLRCEIIFSGIFPCGELSRSAPAPVGQFRIVALLSHEIILPLAPYQLDKTIKAREKESSKNTRKA